MLLANESQRSIGIERISQIKRHYFPHRKNVAQDTFDNAPLHLRKTICFHAGLRARHLNMSFSELSFSERTKIVEALNSIIETAKALPSIVSIDDCYLNQQ